MRKENIVRKDRQKDFAVIRVDKSELLTQFVAGEFDPNESNHFKEVIILGYPNYSEGDTAKAFRSQISSRKQGYLGALLFCIAGIIQHGMSGGPVLDEEYKVVGIVKGGVATTEDAEEVESGFIPVEYALHE